MRIGKLIRVAGLFAALALPATLTGCDDEDPIVKTDGAAGTGGTKADGGPDGSTAGAGGSVGGAGGSAGGAGGSTVDGGGDARIDGSTGGTTGDGGADALLPLDATVG
jgi:hypothetical protein